MHVAFIPYGDRHAVENLLRDMEAQTFKMPFKINDPNVAPLVSNDELKTPHHGYTYNRGSIRYAPFGIVEYVFPENGKDHVLSTLGFGQDSHYVHLGWKLEVVTRMLRKFMKLEKAPEFNNKLKLLWNMNNVNVIPLGVRYDDMEWKDPNGTIHEAL